MGRYDTFNVLVPKRDKKEVKKDSHYNDKIDNRPGRPAGITRAPGASPFACPSAISRTRPPSNPTTSAESRRPASLSTKQRSPTAT